MSTTAVVTMANTATSPTTMTQMATTTSGPESHCPSCGDAFPPSVEQTSLDLAQAQARIADLEAQVRHLNQKAAAAVDRWAGYEEELQRLRAQGEEGSPPPPPPPKNEAGENKRTSGGILASGTNRLSLLLSRHKSSPNLKIDAAAVARPPGFETERLLHALKREISLRKEAEGKVAATSREVEELSVSLFEQANEMVAEERRARAKLEERVSELERRDKEKTRRFEKLEGAMAQIERVRALLAETEPQSRNDL
ncbi:ribosomal protein L32 [Emericellopsis atlantica]|uniref:Ribosomal protein L32 n=1 Tax=Emericellopsis atlantica TaxID=2614577 RepID=A0A9P8CMN3_9HYPO|nr:ribosomal protein L32 [Emericellopsis atlantica]KAG9250876.1 ribosomal protein L32 [Emericellopsis atlantica]